MDILGQSALLVGVTSLGSGLSVLSRNVRNKLYLSFALITTLISGWALSFFMDKIWPDVGFYRLHLVFNILLAPAGLNLVHVLVRIQDAASRKLLGLSVLLSFLLLCSVLLGWTHLSPILLMVYFSPALIIPQILQLMVIDLQIRRGVHRLPKIPTVGVGKRGLIYFGALIVLCTSVMDHIPFMGKLLPSFGNFGLAVYIFFLSQAISQQRLLNFGALFTRFMVLLSVAFTLSVIYALPVAWIENSPGLFFLNSFIASFLLLTLLDPLRTFVSYVTQRLMSPRQQRLQQKLREAQRRLTGIVDMGTLFQVILNTAETTLEPTWAGLFVLRSDGTKFRRIRELNASGSGGAAKSHLREVLANHPLVSYSEDLARQGKFPILFDQILENEMERSASRLQREDFARLIDGLKALGSNMLIPLLDSGKMLGFVVLQVPSPPEPWGNNWGLLPLVYPFFDQAAQMMQRMEIFARQREKERLATLGEMAAGLAHEIRNPLGAIKGAAQYLDPSSDRPESQFLKVIVEEVDRLNRVVTQFLDYSKPAAVDLKLVDVSLLVEKTLELLKPGIDLGIKVEFHAAPIFLKHHKAYVMASAGQIQQVVINLVQNANKALLEKAQSLTSESVGGTLGMIRVGVSLEGEPPLGEVAITVEDTGSGIKKENLEKLFIPFFTTSPSGTGLGLSISQKIIEAHRGRIEVASEEGRFTRFSVILPLVKP